MAFIPVYILNLFFLIIVDYFIARKIETATPKAKKYYFWISIISNLGMLFIFKYFNFFNANIEALAHTLHWNYSIASLRLILPIGLSFHTFQSLAYVIEVYKGRYKAETHLGKYALYVLFFPQLVAGPIERPANLLPQLKNPPGFSETQFFSGLRLMLWGFFKKVVIADRLAIFVDQVFGDAGNYTGVSLVIAIVFYAFQIYCDFSGYSDIAIGAARVLGFNLTRNFDRPYIAKSINEFWHRWHISLSSWFRDYVYIPLGGSRVSTLKWCRNILIAFLLSGLWHGAGWTFVIWGGLHGIYLIVGKLTLNLREKIVTKLRLNKLPRIHATLQRITVFGLVCISWIFFRAENLPDAGAVLRGLTSGWGGLSSHLRQGEFIHNNIFLGSESWQFYLAVLGILILGTVESLSPRFNFENNTWLKSRPAYARSMIYSVGILLISGVVLFMCLFGVFQNRGFIYFQF